MTAGQGWESIRSWFLRAILALLIAVLGGSYIGWVVLGVAFQSHHGIVRMDIESPAPVYLKRAAWGLNHDQLALTTNQARCSSPDPKTDFMFSEVESGAFSLVYRSEGTVLHVYEGENTPTSPKQTNSFPLEIERHPRAPPPGFDGDWYLRRYGLKQVFVELDDPPCETFWSQFFSLGSISGFLLIIALVLSPIAGLLCFIAALFRPQPDLPSLSIR